MMARFCNEYLRPDSVEGALQALTGSNGVARIIAGGTDLLLDIDQGRHPPVQRLVDVSGIPEMNVVEETGDSITFGAAMPLHQLVRHPLIRAHALAVAEAGVLIGGPQVRSVATLGGNVAHALPAGDGTIALLAMDAQAQVVSSEGRHWVSVETLFKGPGETSFNRGSALIAAFRVSKASHNEGSAFERVMRPQGVAIAILNMGCWVRATQDGHIDDIRIAIGPAGPRPLRARKTEAALKGRLLEAAALADAQAILLQEASLRTSPHRATSDYRRHLTGVLLERTLGAAHARALPGRVETA